QGSAGGRHHHGHRRPGRDRRRAAVQQMNGLDERRIQEIVEKVMARLGTPSHLPATPLEAVERAAVAAAPRAPAYGQPLPSEMRHKNVRVPNARMGIFPDVDSAAKAAKKAFE